MTTYGENGLPGSRTESWESGSRTTTWAWDEAYQLVGRRDPGGGEWEFAHDDRGRRTREFDADGVETTWTWGPFDTPSSISLGPGGHGRPLYVADLAAELLLNSAR